MVFQKCQYFLCLDPNTQRNDLNNEGLNEDPSYSYGPPKQENVVVL